LSDGVLRNSAGTMQLQLDDLVDGTYAITSFHHTTQFGPSERPPATPFDILLTDSSVAAMKVADDVIMSDNNSLALSTRTVQFVVSGRSSTVLQFQRPASVGLDDHMQLCGFNLSRLPNGQSQMVSVATGAIRMLESNSTKQVAASRTDGANAIGNHLVGPSALSATVVNDARDSFCFEKPIPLLDHRTRDRHVSSFDSVFTRWGFQRRQIAVKRPVEALEFLNIEFRPRAISENTSTAVSASLVLHGRETSLRIRDFDESFLEWKIERLRSHRLTEVLRATGALDLAAIRNRYGTRLDTATTAKIPAP
jgi:hypothetical protein